MVDASVSGVFSCEIREGWNSGSGIGHRGTKVSVEKYAPGRPGASCGYSVGGL